MKLEFILQILVTILGFVVSYINLSKKMHNEIKQNKEIKTISKLEDTHYQILDKMITTMIEEEYFYEKNNEMIYIYNKIYAYGSIDSIKIISSLQKYLKPYKYKNYDRDTLYKIENNIQDNIASYNILLASQIKYDVTGYIINPKYWIILTSNEINWDYMNMKTTINNIVDELELNKKFKIKNFHV